MICDLRLFYCSTGTLMILFLVLNSPLSKSHDSNNLTAEVNVLNFLEHFVI